MIDVRMEVMDTHIADCVWIQGLIDRQTDRSIKIGTSSGRMGKRMGDLAGWRIGQTNGWAMDKWMDRWIKDV
eukprot:scaffold550847_cov20-Prasinocladus_malaysianus.AAC.1